MDPKMEERSREDALRGVIVVQTAEGDRELPVLMRGQARVWRQRLAEQVAGRFKGLVEMGDDVSQMMALVAFPGDVLADLLLAYDESGVLGSLDWVDEHMTDPQVEQGFRRVALASFPLAPDLRAAASVLLPSIAQELDRIAGQAPAKDASTSPAKGGSSAGRSRAAGRRATSTSGSPTSS